MPSGRQKCRRSAAVLEPFLIAPIVTRLPETVATLQERAASPAPLRVPSRGSAIVCLACSISRESHGPGVRITPAVEPAGGARPRHQGHSRVVVGRHREADRDHLHRLVAVRDQALLRRRALGRRPAPDRPLLREPRLLPGAHRAQQRHAARARRRRARGRGRRGPAHAGARRRDHRARRPARGRSEGGAGKAADRRRAAVHRARLDVAEERPARSPAQPRLCPGRGRRPGVGRRGDAAGIARRRGARGTALSLRRAADRHRGRQGDLARLDPRGGATGHRARRRLLGRRAGRGAAAPDRHGRARRGARRAGHARSRDRARAGQGHHQRGAAAHAQLRRRPAHRSDPQRGALHRRVEQSQLPGRHAPADPARRGGVGVPAQRRTISSGRRRPRATGRSRACAASSSSRACSATRRCAS